MNLSEYSLFDACGLAEAIRRKETTPSEVAACAMPAIEAVNPKINAVIETYEDRISGLDDRSLANGPFRGVPLVIKDVRGHLEGRLIEFGSRLAKGMIGDGDSHFAELLKGAGINIIGRSNAPEFSSATSTENLLYGNTSTPWREGYSAGGSTGGGAAAVAAGLVPIAHGSDIGGSIRIPASWCGGVGLKPSRGRVSMGPQLDEGGFGLAMNFVQTKSMRDTAHLLDILSVPQPGDPFVIPRPADGFVAWLDRPVEPLRIAYTVKPTMQDAPVDPEIAAAVVATARKLADLGHIVEQADLPFNQEEGSSELGAVWLFGFHQKCDDIGRKTGRTPGPDNLEPVTWDMYQKSRSMDPYRLLDALAGLNRIRRDIGRFFTRFDVVVTPTTALVSEPHGRYGLNLPGVSAEDYMLLADRPVQYAFPFNATGGPAISLPLAWHSNGLPIGVQLGARPAEEHLLIALGAALERETPWRNKIAPIHASRI